MRIISLSILLLSVSPLWASGVADTNGGLEIFKSTDGRYFCKLGGRLHVDSVSYDADEARFPNGTKIRRAKLSMKGGVGQDWNYKLEMEQTGTGTRLGEAFIQYDGWDSLGIALGQVIVPGGIESTIGSNESFLMENSLSSVFGAELGLGVFAGWTGKYMTLSGSVVQPKMEDKKFAENDPTSVGGRLTFSPIHSKCKALHSGISYRHHNVPEQNNFQFSTKPEVRSRNVSEITTNFPVNSIRNYTVVGGELAAQHGSGILATEYTYARVRGDKTKLQNHKDLSYYGYYILGSYVLTGETRAYSVASGSFGGVRPRSKKGALEISLRHGYVKLLDSISAQTQVAGSLLSGNARVANAYSTSLGLTWWVNKNVRFMADYTYTRYVNAIGASGPEPDQGVSGVGLRAQVNW